MKSATLTDEQWSEILKSLVGAQLGTRKHQALWIQDNVRPEYRGMVFALLDQKNIDDAVWKMIEPKGA